MRHCLLIRADAQALPLADASIDCVVTSPPYWSMRDYGVDGQIGLEPTLDEWLEAMVAVFREVRRVLRPWATLWLNLGDAYATNTAGAKPRNGEEWVNRKHAPHGRAAYYGACGLKPKDLIGLPWRVAFALQADGWWLRRDVIWHKPNAMPESAQDRPATAHEYLFLLTKSPHYYFDQDAIREPYRSARPVDQPVPLGSAMGRKARSVWSIASGHRPEAHFATFPAELAGRCILAGTSMIGNCPICGRPWTRRVQKKFVPQADVSSEKAIRGREGQKEAPNRWAGSSRGVTEVATAGWEPSCDCGRPDTEPAVVLDPFVGSGTTARTALELGRQAVGVDISAQYLKEIAAPYCRQATPYQSNFFFRA